MSKKSARSPVQKPVPRARDVIMSAHDALILRSGVLQYTVAVHKQELHNINVGLGDLNRELFAREQLDAEEKALSAKIAATSSVPNVGQVREVEVANGN